MTSPTSQPLQTPPRDTTPRKHVLTKTEFSGAKRRRDEQTQRTYNNSQVQGYARAHLGDSFQHHEYYAPVYQYANQMKPAERPSYDSAESSEAFDSLKFEQMNDRYFNISPACTKTCQWLFGRETYRDWVNRDKRSDNNGFLWIKGKPAVGKSTLMKHAFDHARKHSEETTIIAFFFNARGSDLEKSTEGMYRSLLYQMMEKIPGLQKTLGGQRHRSTWPVRLLSTLFREAVMSLKENSLTCYIDALDECNEADVRYMIEAFEGITESAILEHLNFRICFSSRHYPHVSMKACQELVLEDQEGHGDDISAYIQDKLRVSTRLKSEMATKIRQRASGIFLWVVLVVQILNTDSDHGHAFKIKDRLEEIPDDLDKLFQDILVRGTQEDTYLIPTLQWIMFAKRPLDCKELYHAVMSTPPDKLQGANIGDEPDSEIAKRFLLNSSKGLAETTRGKHATVQFIHESVRNYLRDTGFRTLAQKLRMKQGHDQIARDLSQDLEGSSHEYLRQCCLGAISENTTRQLSLPDPLPTAKTKEARDLRDQIARLYPFLGYAVENVIFHSEEICSRNIHQNEIAWSFPLATWVTLNNMFEKYEVRQYSSSVTRAYVFTEKGAPGLLNIELQRNAEFFSSYERHRTILRAAIHGRNAEVVEVILKHGAIAHHSQEEQRKLLGVALAKRALESAKLLIEGGISIKSEGGSETMLISCSEKGNGEAVQLLLDQGAEVNAQGRRYGNALQAACAGGHQRVAEMLLDKGAAVNARGAFQNPTIWRAEENVSILYITSTLGHEKLTEILLDRGAGVNDQAGHYGYALQAACAGGYGRIVELLLGKGAQVSAQDGYYNNALQAACAQGHEKITELLLDKGAGTNVQGGYYGNALQAACAKGHAKITELLLGKDADVNAQGGYWGNSLQAACAGGHEKIARTLLAKGADGSAKGGKY